MCSIQDLLKVGERKQFYHLNGLQENVKERNNTQNPKPWGTKNV